MFTFIFLSYSSSGGLTLANKTPRSDPPLPRLSFRDRGLSRLLSFYVRSLSTCVCGTQTIAGVCIADWALPRSLWV